MSERRARLVRITFWALVLCISAAALYALRPAIGFLFPRNVALETGANPVILGQISAEQAATKMLHMTFMPFTGFHHPSNMEVSETFQGKPYRFRTNNYGFLTKYELHPFEPREFSKKARNDRWVLFTGGSGAYGWGASSNETTISYVLEDILNKQDPGHYWHVVNLAMGAWNSYQEYLALDLYGTEFDPDWVVVYDGRNDLMVPTYHGESVPGYYFYTGQRRLNDLFEAEAGSSFVDRLPVTRYRRLAERISRIAETPTPTTGAENVKKAIRFYLHGLGLIADRFRDRKLLLLLQATTAYQRDQNVITPGYDQARPLVQELARKHGDAQFEDTNGYFATRTPGDADFVDDCHLSDRGQAILASNIARLILDRERNGGGPRGRQRGGSRN